MPPVIARCPLVLRRLCRNGHGVDHGQTIERDKCSQMNRHYFEREYSSRTSKSPFALAMDSALWRLLGLGLLQRGLQSGAAPSTRKALSPL